ncbi:unnamed protein product [Porites evermanni]|uniref:Ig-like domain-containing protein n=1 Tax=Porites evermanni TaxID=104178 RepID=A0ABN8MP63_9CNID|nr:unnamed protein product [Porites evermanni]
MSFQLFKDNVPMEISASGVWVKTLSEGGMFVYKCVANNSIGSASSATVNITVHVSSTIQPLQNKTITEGGDLNQSCNASGTPPPVVSWVRISTGQRFDGNVSQLININRSESRDYRCEASNECGNASEVQDIDVQYKPENVQLTTNASANKACQNNVLKLTCSVGDANPEVTSYQLFRNDTDLGESNTGMLAQTLSNSGLSMYKCVANNSVGSAESPSVYITVNVPPTIAPILDRTVNETDNLTLVCVATGVRSPFVSWVKVSSGQRTNGSLLQLTNVSRSQAGEYRCEASNECGNAVERVNITVPFKPENVRLVATNIGDEACQNDSVSLGCSADASPPVWYYQFFENDVLLGSNTSGMLARSLSSSGELIYRCVASNLVGAENSANVSFYVGVPSSIQSIQNETWIEGSSWNLTCDASGIP